VRDVTLADDASQLRSGTAPQVMAALRNLAIGVLRQTGPGNLATALPRHAREPTRPLPPWESVSDETDITTERRRPGEEGVEPGPRLLRQPRSGPWMPCDLWFSCPEGDRSCPPRTSGSRCHADPPRTEGSVPVSP
jgi:hypothetical protein